jgi:MFS family permease
MLFVGLGSGMTSTPLFVAATNDVKSDESGLASGIVNTSFMMGGALAVAVLASLSEARTAQLRESGEEAIAALNGGYRVAFWAGAGFTALAALLAGFLLRPGVADGPASRSPRQQQDDLLLRAPRARQN